MPGVSDLGVWSKSYAKLGAQMLNVFERPGYNPILNGFLTQFFGGPYTVGFWDRTGYYLTIAHYSSFNKQLTLLSGVRRIGGVTGLIRAWTENPRADAKDLYWCSNLWNLSTQVMARTGFPNARTTPGEWHVIGHSLGGALACPLAQNIYASAPNAGDNIVKLTQYGSPKVRSVYGNANFAAVDVARWINDGDNVPAYPPTAAQAPLIHGVLGRTASYNSRRWVRASTVCMVLAADGTVSVQTVDPPGATFPGSTLQGAINSVAGALGAEHQIDEYVNRLAMADAAPPPSPPVLPPQVTPVSLPPVPAPTPAVAAQVQASVVAYRESVTTNEQIQTVVPKLAGFTWYKSAGLWYLSFYGSEIANHSSKRKILALAQHGNKFLKYFQTVGQADSSTFVATLTKYLQDAADPARGFVPTLNDANQPPPDFFGG